MTVAASWMYSEGTTDLVAAFLQVDGMPSPVVREIRDVMRPGVDNVGHFLGALRGQRFQITTHADAADLPAAKAVQAFYRSMEGSRFDYYWQQTLVGTVYVYEVTPKQVDVSRAAAGGFVDGLAMAVSTWTLRVLA